MDSMHMSLPEHSNQLMTYTLSKVILYEQLSCIIILHHLKVSLNMQLIILTLYSCNMTVAYKVNSH